MELRHLEHFVAVAEERNFSGPAQPGLVTMTLGFAPRSCWGRR